MSIELNQRFSQLVKRVEFFPFEWSANLLAVCFADSVNLYTFVESANYRREVLDCVVIVVVFVLFWSFNPFDLIVSIVRNRI